MPASLDLDDDLLPALDGREGPAQTLSEGELAAAVQSALARALPQRPSLFQRRKVQLLLLAASLGLTGFAAALVITRSPWTGSAAFKTAETDASARHGGLVRPAPLAPVAAAPAPDSTSAAERPATPERPSTMERPSTAERLSPRESAADSLKAANQLRRQARWADAERAYARIATSYGASAQGSVAALAAASLRLEHLKDPRGALRLYQAALRAGALPAEAALGVAECYRALGDRTAEIAALRRLVASHPDALFRERAERRLQALGAATP